MNYILYGVCVFFVYFKIIVIKITNDRKKNLKKVKAQKTKDGLEV